MLADRRPKPPRARRSLSGCLGVASVVLVLAVAGLAAFVFGPDEDAIETRWRRGAGFDPLRAYPPRDANPAALQLEALVTPLGLDMAPKSQRGRARPTKEAEARLAAIAADLKAHLAALRRPAPVLREPTAALAAFLAAAAPELRAARTALVSGDAPAWELHLERGYDNEIPNLLGHLGLHRLLVATACESARQGQAAETAAWLAAAWRLREALARDPLVIQQLIAGSELGNELALLRALEPPPGWRNRLAASPRPAMERAMRLESWVTVYAMRTGQLEKQAGKGRAMRFVVRVLGRHGVAQIVESMDHILDSLAHRDLGSFDAERFSREQMERIPRWNLIARLLLPNFLDAPVRAARSELDLELTRHLLGAREVLATRGTVGLAALPIQQPSRVRGFAWLYELRPERLTIRSTGNLPTTVKTPLPLEVWLPLVSPPPSAASIAAPPPHE